MSSAALRVELPAYSHSFQVNVQPESTIREVKQEIARVCPGSPSPDGQRLVFRGRFLSDEEKVEDVWKSPDDSRVVHLAVHPSAWTTAPPTIPPAAQTTSAASPVTPTSQRPAAMHPRPYGVQAARSGQPSSPPFPSVAYIQYLHNLALGTLSGGAVTIPPQPSTSELSIWRAAAMSLYHNRGWAWPAVFDEPFPSGSAEEGAVYEPTTIDGLPYLSLTTPNATPTPAQAHALKVLSHTFSLLSMANDPMLYAPSANYPTYQNTPTTNLNQRLQELGFPPLRLVPDPNVARNANDAAGAAEIRAIPVRALLVPLVMLAFRTLLLLYFFSPSKRPLFGILLSAWIVYEAWNAMRLVLNDGNDRRGDLAANPAERNAAPGQGVGAGAPDAPARGGTANRNARPFPQVLLDRLALMNLSEETAFLDADTPAPPPSVLQKAKMFVALFLITLYPAAWDRRRAALRRREGRIRTEANAREAAMTARAERESAGADAPARTAEEEARVAAQEQVVARYERRPEWVKAYVQRVQYSEWVDDP